MVKIKSQQNLSQSAVSQAISNLERITGKKLLRHHRNKFILSSEGRLLVEMLKPILRQLRDVDDIFCAEDSQPQGDVEIACPRSVALSLLVPRLRLLKEKFPKITPRLHLFTPDVVRERLLKSETEVGILTDNVDLSPFETFLLNEGYFRLYRHRDATTLATDQAIFTENRREVLQFRRAYETVFGRPIKVFMEASSWDVVARFTQHGFACGFLPDYAGQSCPDLVPVELDLPPLTYRLYGAVKSKAQLSRNAKAALSCITDSL